MEILDHEIRYDSYLCLDWNSYLRLSQFAHLSIMCNSDTSASVNKNGTKLSKILQRYVKKGTSLCSRRKLIKFKISLGIKYEKP